MHPVHGVDEVDAEVERALHDADAVRVAVAGGHAQPRAAAAAEAGNTDLESGAAEGGVFH